MSDFQPTTILPSSRDRFMQIARDEMAKFEKRERQMSKADKRDRAAHLGLPVEIVPAEDVQH